MQNATAQKQPAAVDHVHTDKFSGRGVSPDLVIHVIRPGRIVRETYIGLLLLLFCDPHSVWCCMITTLKPPLSAHLLLCGAFQTRMLYVCMMHMIPFDVCGHGNTLFVVEHSMYIAIKIGPGRVVPATYRYDSRYDMYDASIVFHKPIVAAVVASFSHSIPVAVVDSLLHHLGPLSVG